MLNEKSIAFLVFLGIVGLVSFFYGVFLEGRKKYRRGKTGDNR